MRVKIEFIHISFLIKKGLEYRFENSLLLNFSKEFCDQKRSKVSFLNKKFAQLNRIWIDFEKWFSQFSRRTRSNRSLFPKTSFLITKISGRRCDWLFDKSVYKACAKNRVIHFSRKIDTKCGNTVLGLTTGWLVSLVLSGQGHVSSSIVVIHVVNHRLLYFIIRKFQPEI